MKEKIEEMWFDFLDSGVPSILFFAGMIAILIYKPIIFLWILAVIGVYAIVTVLSTNFTGG